MKIRKQITTLALLFYFLKLQSCAAFWADIDYADSRREDKSIGAESAALTAAATPLFAPRVSPEKAMSWLKNGNTRYVKGSLRKDGQSEADRQSTFYAQKPHSIVLSCSDSNVPSEIIFDQKIGEIYVIRTAAHTVDDAVIASLEYAVAYLGPQNLVIMGHTHCGPIQRALENTTQYPTPLLGELSSTIYPHLKDFHSQPPTAGHRSEAWSHVVGVISEIKAKSALISERLRTGQLQINPAVYDTESGLVEFTSPQQ